MRVNAIQPQTERNRQDRFVRRAEKLSRKGRMLQVRAPIRPVPGVCAAADTTRGENHLSNGRNQEILLPSGRSLGEHRLKLFHALALVGSLSAAPAANAAVVLSTDPTGYSGPLIDLVDVFVFPGKPVGLFRAATAGPLALPGGITYTSESLSSTIGNGSYFLDANGMSMATRIIGTNDDFAFVTLAFSAAVSSFGGFWNYAPGIGNNPVIEAYDVFNNLLGSFDLAVLAPISTPGATDAFAFRGIESDAADIASIRFGGSFMILAETGSVPVAPIPLPGACVLLLAAMGGLGVAVRRRKSA